MQAKPHVASLLNPIPNGSNGNGTGRFGRTRFTRAVIAIALGRCGASSRWGGGGIGFPASFLSSGRGDFGRNLAGGREYNASINAFTTSPPCERPCDRAVPF